MAMVVKVRFKRASKLYDFDANGLDLHCGTFVVTETARGVELGECMSGVYGYDDELLAAPLKPIIRIATEQDLATQKKNEESEKEAFSIALEKIAEHELEMKLVDVEYAFDHSKIIFYFTANGRVDFRMLVKNLAGIFKTRIELRQIGVRDEAKMLGGIGPCGRPICCRTFLSDFTPVSIKMAKEQNLSLNPTKISGLCDRLMCCLKYEQDHYEVTRKRMPRVGREIITPDGPGTINAINVLEETVRVRVAVGDTFELRQYPIDDCKRPGQDAQQGGVPRARQEDAPAQAMDAEQEMQQAAQEPAGAQAPQDRPADAPAPQPENPQPENPQPEKPQQERPRQERPRPEKQRPEKQRPEKQRPPREGRNEPAPNAEREEKGERPPRADRPQRGDRPHRGERPPRGENQRRGERPPRAENPQKGERPPRGENQRRGERPPRAEQEKAINRSEKSAENNVLEIRETSGLADLL